MKILVAGGAGYIGSVLAPLLREHGYAVDVVDLLWFGNRLPDDIRVTRRDLFQLTREDLEGYEQVIFLAGLSNDPMAEFDPAMNFIQNGALPTYLAFQAKCAGVRRFIYASSCSVYGYTVNQLYDEDAPVTCAYPYGVSKLAGERGVLQLQDDAFSTIALRQGTVNGYSPRMRFDLIVNTMFKCAIEDGVIVVNNPSIWRPLIDVRDTAGAFLRAVQADYAISGVFNVAYDNFTVGLVADLVKDEIQALTGVKARVDIRNVQDYRNYKVSCDRAKTYLGFHPKYAITDTVRELFRHREEYGDFAEDRYYNIRVFKQLAANTAG
ncbi:MAG TPA: SDR family oxidoreductase [Candidatus Hydrogenedentes bacterium]|nr:SDR family oxidoreductase [Candidatus Hydrogenedentota bacterium]HNT86938.1 SDR family oxidoreductase [Candidatus Hydrogenedentota bacterium]